MPTPDAPNTKQSIVCFFPFFGDQWTWFVEELTSPAVHWAFFFERQPPQWLRWIRAHNLTTPITGLRAVMDARRRDARLIVTIDPRLGFWIALWCRLLAVKTEHLVFSFNFPELPAGLKRRVYRFAYQRVDHLRVHSTMEVALYRDWFAIPESRIHLGLWCMNMPEIAPPEPLKPGNYLSAIGGNARDYATLLAACRLTPEIPMIWVVRPHNIEGMELPPNVQAATNIPYEASMNYLAYSSAMVLPLLAADSACGHVTLVSAMYLGRAILATASSGITDYVQEGVTGVLYPAGDCEALARGMRQLWSDAELAARLGENGLRFASAFCSEAVVRREMAEFLARRGLGKEQAER